MVDYPPPLSPLFLTFLLLLSTINKHNLEDHSSRTNPRPTMVAPFEMDSKVPPGEMMSGAQKAAITALERTGGCISLIAVVLIFVAYGLAREVRNVQNTFIVFASVANVGASIASIIAMDGLNQGTESALCQAQSFMFEM